MMNAKAIYILVLFLLINNLVYSQQDSAERCPIIKEEYHFDTGLLMKTSSNPDSTRTGSFINGNAIGFSLIRYFDCPDIFDEQYQDFLEWSIASNIDSFFFSFSHDQPPLNNLNYFRVGSQRGPFYNLKSVSGFIKGIRQGNKWFVNIDIEIISKHNSLSSFQKRRIVFSKVFETLKKKKKKRTFS